MTDEISDKHHVIGPDGPPSKRHVRLMRFPVSLFVVAANAGADEIFPRVLAASRLWDNMVNGQRHVSTSTVLTTMAVPSQDVFSCENNLLEGNPYVDAETHNTREGHRGGNRPQQKTITCLDKFGLSQVEKDDRLLYVADAQWLVVLIQHEHLSSDFSSCR